MSTESAVIAHYRHGALEDALLAGVVAAGKDPDRLNPDDLAGADEFHIGGRQATQDFAGEFTPRPGMHLIDIGAGIGGPSRFFTQHYGCRVTGIDLCEEFVVTAASLARRVGLADRVDYRQASALDLPFPDGTFDGAYMQHVGMNIADKARLFHEVHRVLKPDAPFAIYDVMRVGEGPFDYPVPWAAGEDTNFIETPATYRVLLAAGGFEPVKQRERGQFALEVYRARVAGLSQKGGPPPLGTHIMMGASARQKTANMLAMIERGLIAPVEIICRRVEANPQAANV